MAVGEANQFVSPPIGIYVESSGFYSGFSFFMVNIIIRLPSKGSSVSSYWFPHWLPRGFHELLLR